MGIWKGLSRQGGGVGTRGPGESLLETDRRVIEQRLIDLRAKLSEVQKQRERSRRSRGTEGLFLGAFVGYTNVGKSTLLNALVGSDVLVADQPFATLDPTTRRMPLHGGGAILLSDTVGFVNKLPPTLVAAFRATLEELEDADLLIHVADVAHPNLHERLVVVRETLRSLELADRPSLLVFDKSDVLRGEEGAALREALGAEFPAAIFTSATTGEGLDALRTRLAETSAARFKHVKVVVPYSDGASCSACASAGSSVPRTTASAASRSTPTCRRISRRSSPRGGSRRSVPRRPDQLRPTMIGSAGSLPHSSQLPSYVRTSSCPSAVSTRCVNAARTPAWQYVTVDVSGPKPAFA